MRRGLDMLYAVSGALSGVFLFGIAATIIAQVGGRLAGLTIDSTETAGFCLAASTFLGLAYTLRHGGHIRVTLAIRYAGPRLRRWIELWCVTLAALATLYFIYWAGEFVLFSWKYNELSPGLLAIPFWIPRSAMVVGAAVFFVALVDEWVTIWRGDLPAYETNAETVLAPEEPLS
ncbi:MAG: TRAP transporter substrate-binding protein DctP [Rhodobacteraceae bacterium]|nr:TRAP transporter substrate-binding protein DctP [Paracoccaceae bacterium]